MGVRSSAGGRRGLRWVAVCASCLVLLASTPSLASISSEREIGEEVVREARQHLRLIHDYEVDQLIDKIGERLVAALGNQPFHYEFFVVADDSINAFAVPGGKVFVHAGLISRVEGIDELAGVMAHEIAHAHAHHAARQQEKAAAASYASLLGIFLSIIHPVLGQAALAAGQGIQLKYQREFEREADLLGVGYATKAGYNPGALLRMLRKIYDEQRLNPTVVPPYFLSHPLTGERLAYLESVVGKAEWDVSRPGPSWRLERVQAIVRAYSQTRRQAVPPYERRLAAAKDADRGKALELIGTLMVHGDEYEQGLHYLEEADRLGRSVDRELGRAYLRTGAFEKARERLERVVASTPGDWNAVADLGEVHLQTGDYDKAASMLKRAVELDRYNPELHRMLGRAMDKTGSRGAGFYHFAQAAELEGRAGQALAYYRKAAESLDESDPLMKDIRAHIGELGKAEDKRPRPPRAVPVPVPGPRR